MKPTLFTVSADGHERHVFTNDPTAALRWCLQHDEVIGAADTIVLQRRTDVVELGKAESAHVAPALRRSAPRRAIPPPMPKKRAKAAKPAKSGEVPAGMILVSELARQSGITTEGMRHRLNKAKVKLHRMDGKGRPMIVDEVDARAKLKARAEKPSKHSPRKPRGAGEPRIVRADAFTRQQEPKADKMLLLEKAAQQLGLTEDQVREIKRNGNVPGGNGWVNFTQLQAYMASPDYEPPFAAN